MSVRRIQSFDADRLVYRQGPSYVWTVVIGLIGLATLQGTVSVMIEKWPIDAWALGGGAVFALCMILWAIRKTAQYEIVLDRGSGQAQLSVRWLWRSRHEVVDISDATQVLRCVSQPIETPDSHWVAVRTSDSKELRLFEGSSELAGHPR